MNDDVDVDQLCRVVRTLEARAKVLIDAKHHHENALEQIESELADVLHARGTMVAGVATIKSIREEPEQPRH